MILKQQPKVLIPGVYIIIFYLFIAGLFGYGCSKEKNIDIKNSVIARSVDVKNRFNKENKEQTDNVETIESFTNKLPIKLLWEKSIPHWPAEQNLKIASESGDLIVLSESSEKNQIILLDQNGNILKIIDPPKGEFVDKPAINNDGS